MPMKLYTEYGGWRNRKLIELYEKYAKLLLDRYGKRVRYWITFNEINVLLSGFASYKAGGLIFTEEDNREEICMQALHHQLLASAKICNYAHRHYPELKMGCMIAYITKIFRFHQVPLILLHEELDLQWQFLWFLIRVLVHVLAYLRKAYNSRRKGTLHFLFCDKCSFS